MHTNFISKNKNTTCLVLLLLLISLLIIGCKSRVTDEEYLKLEKELKVNYHKSIPKNATRLVFITDEGCPNCVISFSQFILQNIDTYKDSGLIFIHSYGKNVDIDSYSSMKNRNIILSSDYPKKTEIIPSLGIVYLKPLKQEIDTIIHIDASIIKEQFQYILQKN